MKCPNWTAARRGFAMLACVALGVAAWAKDRSDRVPLYVQLELTSASAEAAAAAVEGVGTITKQSDGNLLVRLHPNVLLSDAMSILGKRTGILTAQAIPPKMPVDVKKYKSVTELDDTIDAYRSAFKEFNPYRGDFEKELKDDRRPPGVNFLLAYQQYIHERAYPNSTIDYSVQNEVIQERIKRDKNTFGEGPRALAAGSTWSYSGPNNLAIPYRIYYGITPIIGRVNAVAIHPTDANTYYIGAPAGGVWKSTNKGVTWTPLTDKWPTNGVSSLAIHPTNPNIVIAGTGDYHGFDTPGIGIMRSTNGGSTWSVATATGLGTSAITRVMFHPTNPSIVLASAGGSSGDGVWRSIDAGLTWTKVTTGSEDYTDLVRGVDAVGSPVFYASRSGSVPVVKSIDNGATWQPTGANPASTGNPAIAASPNQANTLYFLDTDGQKIYKSITGGTSWTDTTNNFPGGYNWSQSWYDWHIYCSTRNNGGTNNDVLYVGLITVAQSIDGGATWRHVGGSNFSSTYSNTAIAHNDQHSATINPANPNELLIGNDGGVYLFNYNPTADTYTWSTLNKNLGISQFYTLAVHPTNPDIILGGTQDNASPYSSGDLANWKNPGAGDGAGCAINPQNPLNQYNSSQFHGIVRTNNGWTSATDISPGLSGQSVPFIGRLIIDHNTPRYVYINANYLNRYDAQTNSWTERVGNQNFGSQIRSMAVATGDSNTIYVGGPGYVWKSTTFGTSWTRVNPAGSALPNRTVTSISVNPANKYDIVVTLQGTGGGSVWRCANTNVANPTWVSVSGNLPSLGVNTLARHPGDTNLRWYVGTDIGVYKTENGGTTWTDHSSSLGLPNVLVNELNIQSATQTMTAATFGRGIWQISVAANSPPVASLSFSPATVASGATSTGTVTLTAAAPAGGASINLSSNNAAVVVPPTVTVAAGQTTANFTANTNSVPANVTATVTAQSTSNSVTGTLTVTPPTILGLTISPNTQTGGFNSTGTVNISNAAPTGGLNVSLSSNNAAATVPGFVNVPAGSTTGTFSVTCNTVAVSTVVTITATLAGSSKTATITVLPPNNFVINPSSMVPSGATVFEGNLNSVFASDNNRLGFSPTNLNMKFVAMDFLGTSPIKTLSQMSVKLEVSCDDPKVNLGISAYNYTKNSFVQIATIPSSASDVSQTINVANPSQFVSPTTRQMRLRVQGLAAAKGATSNWKARIDLAQWVIKG